MEAYGQVVEVIVGGKAPGIVKLDSPFLGKLPKAPDGQGVMVIVGTVGIGIGPHAGNSTCCIQFDSTWLVAKAVAEQRGHTGGLERGLGISFQWAVVIVTGG